MGRYVITYFDDILDNNGRRVGVCLKMRVPKIYTNFESAIKKCINLQRGEGGIRWYYPHDLDKLYYRYGIGLDD